MPHIARYFLRDASTPPKWCDTPPWYLVLRRHICAIPHFATYRAIIVRYPIKTNTKEFCDTIATSIARYQKYRCWASQTRDHKVTAFESVVVVRESRLWISEDQGRAYRDKPKGTDRAQKADSGRKLLDFHLFLGRHACRTNLPPKIF